MTTVNPATPDRALADTAPAGRGPTLSATVWVVPPLLVVLVLVAWPMTAVLGESTTGAGPASWVGVLGSAEFRAALGRTAQIAIGSTIGATVLGSFIAVVIAFVPFPGSTLVAKLIDTLIALPSFLITLAFTFLYGGAGAMSALLHAATGGAVPMPAILTSPLGVILAEITYFTPFVVRPLLASFSMLAREQLDVAASLGAGPLRVVRSVLLPEALPGLAAGSSLVLLLTLNEFGIVLFTGAKDVITLPVLIYVRGVVSLDLPGAAVVAVAQVGLSLLLYSLYRFGATLEPRSSSATHIRKGI